MTSTQQVRSDSCDDDDSKSIGQEPHEPGIPERCGGMKQGHCRGATNGRGGSCKAGSGEETQDVAQVGKREGPTKPLLDQPCHKDRFAGVTNTLEQ